MARHDDLLREGAHEAPEPETAEQRTKRIGWGAAGGGILAGGAILAKFGGLSKLFLWLFAFHAFNVWRSAGWVAFALVLAAVVTLAVLHSRKET